MCQKKTNFGFFDSESEILSEIWYLTSLSAIKPTRGGAKKMVKGNTAYINAICSTEMPISFIWMVKYGKIEKAEAEKKNKVNFKGKRFLLIWNVFWTHVFWFSEKQD